VVTFLFLACEYGNSHCFVGDDARCCAARSSLDIHLLFVIVFVTPLFSPSCTILFYFRSRQEELLLSLHNFTFFLKKNSFGFRTEIVVFVVFASSSLRAQRGDTQELFFPVFNTEDLFVKQSSRCKREISPRHELSKGFRGHRHSKAEPNSVQGFPRQRQINRHSFL
jgi:hypothetical protein